MKNKRGFFYVFTREAYQERYNKVYKSLTGKSAVLSMPVKRGSYRLSHLIVNWNKNSVRVHLHGHKIGFINTKQTYIEKITLKRLPNMTDQDAVHVAFYLSPHHWHIPMFSPQFRYKRLTRVPLDARLAAAIDDHNISFSQ